MGFSREVVALTDPSLVAHQTAGSKVETSPFRSLRSRFVCSFTAFVLAADDAKALSQWLAEHKLGSTRADTWLSHYVPMKFFYVAMRYDPPAQSSAALARAVAIRAETIRISFRTPLPYYPYHEPLVQPGAARSDRLLDLWLVTTEPSTSATESATAAVSSSYVPPARGPKPFAIDEDGSISGVADAGSKLPDKEVIQCLRKAFAGMSFPSPRRGW